MRRYIHIFDDPEDGTPPRTVMLERRDTPTPQPETDADRFLAWENAAEPALLGRIERGTFTALARSPELMAEELVSRFPGVDAWVYHHFLKPDSEALVRELRARGRIVIRPLDMIAQRPAGLTEPPGNWQRVRAEAIARYDAGLRDAAGRLLHFRWFPGGKDASIMLDWSKIAPRSAAAEWLMGGMGFFDQPEQRGGFWWFDQCFERLRTWMLREGVEAVDNGEWSLGSQEPIDQTRLDNLVDQAAYGANLLAWVQGFLKRVDGVGCINGDTVWHTRGMRQTWEAANTRRLPTFDDDLALFKQRYGNIIDLRAPDSGASPAVMEAAKAGVVAWAAEGGLLWPDSRWWAYSPDYPSGAVSFIHDLAVAKRAELRGGRTLERGLRP